MSEVKEQVCLTEHKEYAVYAGTDLQFNAAKQSECEKQNAKLQSVISKRWRVRIVKDMDSLAIPPAARLVSVPHGRFVLASVIINRFIGKFEAVIIALLQLLLVVAVTVGTLQLFIIFVERLPEVWANIDSAVDLHNAMQHAFGGVLVVVLGLELIETLKVYFHEHQVRVEVIMIVGLIAVGRHVIQVDYEHVQNSQLFGLGALIVALSLGYFLVGRSRKSTPPEH
jgi:uncharacterized membrane protein (DUF373 family)